MKTKLISAATWQVGLAVAATLLTVAGSVSAEGSAPAPKTTVPDLAGACQPEAMQSVAAKLDAGVTVKQIPNGPRLPGGVKYTPRHGKTPAYCQVTGSYVTNPKTGKTANFIATFPEQWNGKFLQLGCSGVCGYLLMNDPTAPPITVTAQGYPGQLIQKGYATFGNDLGHVLPSPSSSSSEWMNRPDGKIDADALEDYLVRADRVMADMGKSFTRAFYSRQAGAPAQIEKSYFMGCSQGGREALVAATRFPEKFDGIIAGSPVSNLSGSIWASVERGILAQQPGVTKLTHGQIEMLDARMVGRCDELDGVKDGLIQNPAACDFDPKRDLPICKPGQTGDSCVTEAQAQLVSTLLSGVTDETGRVVQPGYALGAPDENLVTPMPAKAPMDAHIRSIVGKAFDGKPLTTAHAGPPGPIESFHVVVNGAAYKTYYDLMREGTVEPEDFAKLFQQNRKLLWYHNLSDPALTPYMSINRYKRLAALHGGYAKLRNNIRFFTLPGTGHCGLGGDGPSNFDAIGALEGWVERGVAPNAIRARRNDPATSNVISGQIDWSKPPVRTMPLCAFPEMASYKGHGDVNDAANWECRASDRRMLKVAASGAEAGVVR
jgi:feruloyl esterase